MNSLYLDRKNLGIKLDGQALVLYEDGVRKGSVPLHLLERVVMRGNVQLESKVLGALSERNIGLLVLSDRNLEATAMLMGRTHSDSARRLGQYRISLNENLRIPLASQLVSIKVKAQKSLLQKALSARPDMRLPMTSALQILTNIADQLQKDCGELTLSSLRGLEGAAAAGYFSGFTQLFAPSLNFLGRNKRPPRDPVNACLSLGYTLLHHEAVQACHIVGLDPMLGFYHETSFGRESLACDLVEPLRPLIDGWVWEMFSDRHLRNEHFSDDNGRCVMHKAGRRHFYAFYEAHCGAIRRLLRRYGYALVKQYQLVLDGE